MARVRTDATKERNSEGCILVSVKSERQDSSHEQHSRRADGYFFVIEITR